jgi:hypothetical protein
MGKLGVPQVGGGTPVDSTKENYENGTCFIIGSIKV